jgi:DNA (cytosine-5)-methyltransferase 1
MPWHSFGFGVRRMAGLEMRILNLYAGIGGNRALWGDEHEVVAVENVPHIADTYRQLWPNDTVVVADAHQYLLDHYKEFDFIWSSPPCPTHSILQLPQTAKGNVRYPDMRLYQEIIFLKQFCRKPWVVENVKPYYKVLIPPTRELARHLFWSNFHITGWIGDVKQISRDNNVTNLSQKLGITLPPGAKEPRKLLRNCVVPGLGLHILNCRDNLKQEALWSHAA